MPSLSNITIADREPTPVDITFAPHSEDNGVAAFRESGASLLASKMLTCSSVDNGSKVKVRLKLDFPVAQTETINGISQEVVTRRNYGDVTFTFDKSAPLQERKNVVGLLYGALSAAQTDLDKVVTGEEKWF